MKIIPKIILPLLLVGLAYLGFQKLADLKKPPRSQAPPETITTVDIITVSPSKHQPTVESFGTVQPHFESTLTPQITGLIVEVSPDFRVGAIVKKETSLIKIDERSYKSLVIQQESNLADAELVYAEEKIRAQQAIADWLDSGRDLTAASDFVLRKPQLKAALAKIASMNASVRKAKADLVRTEIFAPFDAIITSRTASVGNLANEQQAIGTLVATARVEVRLPLTPDQVSRIDLSTPVSVVLSSPSRPGHRWMGEIIRVEPVISESQTTNAILEITEPFKPGSPALSIGLFVNAFLSTKPLPAALKVSEAALVNDAFLWALDDDDKLTMLPAKRLASEKGHLFLEVPASDLNPPYRIVSRPLATFQPGQHVAVTLETTLTLP